MGRPEQIQLSRIPAHPGLEIASLLLRDALGDPRFLYDAIYFFHVVVEFLGRVANRIVNEVRGINRVVYDVASKPPGRAIEWE